MMNIQEQFEKHKDLVSLKESVKYPELFVLKYKKKVFYNNLWNDFLEESRGLVVDKDFNIVTRPFKKIYNYGVEKEAPYFDDEEFVISYRKINGFMVAATSYQDDILVSSTGSLDSGFVRLGKDWIQKTKNLSNFIKSYDGLTFLFECCDPTDPHIIKETDGLYFLGARFNQTGDMLLGLSNEVNRSCRLNQVQEQLIKFRDLKQDVKSVNHEGFVFYSQEGTRSAKIKSPYYLTKKFLMRASPEKILSKDCKKIFDEEFYPIVDYIRECDSYHFFSLDELAKREYIENWFKNQN